MAKSKKDIDAFQKAMLTNTKVIGKKTKSATTSVPKAKTAATKPKATSSAAKTTEKISAKAPVVSGKGINGDLFQQLESLSKKYNVGVDEFIDASLRMAVELEDFWFKEDKKND